MAGRPRDGIPHPRFLLFAGLLVAAFAVMLQFGVGPTVAFVLAFDVAALAYIASAAGPWLSVTDVGAMARRSARDRGWRVPLLLCSATLVVAVLVGVVILLHDRSSLGPSAEVLAIATEVVAWAFTNLVYAFHYARLYHDPDGGGSPHGGIDVPGTGRPGFADFVNFAFVIGMTCQTADIAISSGRIRRAATFHGVAAFFFNLGVLAITVNIVAGAM